MVESYHHDRSPPSSLKAEHLPCKLVIASKYHQVHFSQSKPADPQSSTTNTTHPPPPLPPPLLPPPPPPFTSMQVQAQALARRKKKKPNNKQQKRQPHPMLERVSKAPPCRREENRAVAGAHPPAGAPTSPRINQPTCRSRSAETRSGQKEREPAPDRPNPTAARTGAARRCRCH